MPVVFSFPVLMTPTRAGDTIGDDAGKEAAASIKWDDAFRLEWVRILQSDPHARAMFDTLLEACDGMDGKEANTVFSGAMSAALQALDTAHTGVLYKKRGTGTAPLRRVNKPWYCAECKNLRRQVKHAEFVFGDQSEEALTARRAFWRCARSAKRRYEYTRATELVDSFVSDPRGFFRAIKGAGGKPDGPKDISVWSNYFKNLFDAVGKNEYEGGSFELH
jgi:hypothetical protein